MMLPPGSPNSRNIKNAVLGDLKSSQPDALRNISGDYGMPDRFGRIQKITNLEVASRILRNITRTNQYYSEFYPYKGVEYYPERNNDRGMTRLISDMRYLSQFDIDDNDLGI